MARSIEENQKQLQRQMAWLSRSIRAFGEDESEAPRIAVIVANLVYSRGKPNSRRRTVSILDRLGQKEKMSFLSTGMVESDGNLIDTHPLVEIPSGIRGTVFRPCCMNPNWSPHSMTGFVFASWWEMPVFKSGGYYYLPQGYPESLQAGLLSRRDVIMTLRDQDGGAHYDDEVSNELYQKLAHGGTSYSFQRKDGSSEPIQGMIEAMAVQIGYELMASLLSHFREIPTSI